MGDKTMSIADIAGSIESGMTVGIGGWGSRRKPMAIVRELLRSDVRDLTVVAFGGPDVGLLAEAGKISRLVYGFVSLDSIPLDPLFTAAREAGRLEDTVEYDEGMFVAGLRAAAQRLDFLPTRAGLGSDVPRMSPQLRTVRSPYSEDEYLAVPASRLDVALLHVNRADAAGNAQYLGPDPYFDDIYAMAADRTYLSCERLVPTSELSEQPPQTMFISRMYVNGVAEAPNGAHFTDCAPDYGRDEAFQAHYARAARDPEEWARFRAEFLEGDEAGYQAAVRAWRERGSE